MAYSKAFYATVLCFFLVPLVISCSTNNNNAPCPDQEAPPLNKGKSSSADYACPKDALKLGTCANMLGQSVVPIIGAPPVTPCCRFLGVLVDLEAAVCLCTAIKANVLGYNIDVPIAMSYVLNNCQKKLPSGFNCEN